MKELNLSRFFSIILLALGICSQAQTQTAISNFGTNPGSINAYQYVPANMPTNAPLVLVLHGCTQTAASYSMETTWNTLADNQKFYVAYAEQTSSNNSLECFNYYVEGDINRGEGEALSIKQITDYMKSNYSIDSTRVFVTGLSAGGAMTCVMCSAYPDIFAAGAEMSGLAYKIATSQIAADLACLSAPSGTAQQRGDSARAQMPGYTGNWPRMAIFHGTSDAVVNDGNATEVIKQFTNLHGCGQTAGYTNTSFNGNSVVQLQQYFDANNEVAVEFYAISGMSHGTAVYPGTCYQQGGNTDALAFDENFYSPFWAAQFFGILQLPYSMSGLTNVAINQQGLSYSVPNTIGSVYTWTVPSGVTIVSGQGSNIVTVNWNNLNGIISVTELPTGGCEQGPVQLFVTPSAQQPALDAGVNGITNPSATVCTSSFTPVFTLANAGTTTLTSVSIYYAVDNNTPQNFSWTGSLATSQSTTVTLPALSVGSGNHVLKIFSSSPNGGADANLANDTVTKNFSSTSPPVVNLGNNIVQCGGNAILNAQNTGDAYAWSTGASSQTISVSQNDIYMVTVTASGCSASASVNVTINPLPVVNLTGGSTCATQLTLDAGNSGSTFKWSTTASTQSITATTSGPYSVTVTNAQNCSGSAAVSVNLNTAPVINLGAGGSICGSQFPLDAGATGSSYLWSTNATTQAINATASGTYSVTVTGGTSCSASASVSIVINPPPSVSFLLIQDTFCSASGLITLEGGNPPGGTFSGSNITGGTFNVSAAGSGTYPVTYSYTDINGCSDSATQNLVVEGCTAINSLSGNFDVTIFPNPNSLGVLYLLTSQPLTGCKTKIFDAIGKIVAEGNITAGNTAMDISMLNPGIYIVHFDMNGAAIRKMFVVE